ncbi:(2Fe-2S)-binding protein [Polynucleobacter wuianus]|uniref:(2Fe-2S)-binding protein n=1 Tax=Polynucleobacter wuianus TaxID=1743168 RepID=A0A191UFC6_9BURK|nr:MULTISPECIES: (2Fe-2S)-binding protein [Polynucleobacter]ANI99733.1 (2Fe-2S)-binding protein [Polynucleobacter wuianus]MBU3548265.1 (2Fe-2S)-binding protein [Polynucleobacter sp. P1-05-14]MBU3552534.1 (2Fe-2S)-binding protein [Polynucleobacter sp. MWH-Post4-6-1]
MSEELMPFNLNVNGKAIETALVPASLNMIEFLHEYLNLTGSRLGCGQGLCQACTVIVDNPDGSSTESITCLVPAIAFNGKSIRTIEGHGKRDAKGQLTAISPVQQAFLENYSFQCGYCTPGFVNAATVLIESLQKHPIPKSHVEKTVMESLNGHICRCTGYVQYYRAIKELILKTPGLTV